ncbi:GAF domain-containing protein, partial [bacterium]|nr:GAF domain-containing protein [bacterium]
MVKKNGNPDPKRNQPLSNLWKRIVSIHPFRRGENELLRERIAQQEQQIRMLNNILGAERKRSAQLALLSEVEQHLKTVLDQPVAAQLVVNAVQSAMNCNLVAVLMYDEEHKEFVVLAVAGEGRVYMPPSYRQSAEVGLIGRAFHQRKAIVTNDTRIEPDYVGFENHTCLSEMIVPLIQHGNLKGMLTVDHQNLNMFSLSDSATLEIVAEQLLGAWERSNYHQRLTELIQAGITLTTLLDTEAVIEQVAIIARKTLEARFTFITLLDHEGNFTRTTHAGNMPQLLRTLKKNPETDPIIQATLNASHTLRVRDLKKSSITAHLKHEPTIGKGMLAFPIRLHQLNVGVILAFGKQGQSAFSENDESLANLIASQTAAAIESTWLYQELRTT